MNNDDDVKKHLINRMIRRLDPYKKNNDMANVRILIDRGIHHANFEINEIREYYKLATYATFITTRDNKFFLNEDSGELFILLELL